MRLSSLLIFGSTFTSAAILSLVAASFSADWIEENSRRSVMYNLHQQGMSWSKVHTEGLRVFITGVAPTEADRFKAISAAGQVVDAARVIDNMQVEASAEIGPPRFSVEILRNDSGIQLIGLIPENANRTMIRDKLEDLEGAPAITDFLEAATYAAPEGWAPAVNFALSALDLLPRAKISVEAGRVAVTATSDSPAQRRELENDLRRRAPASVEVVLNITAPRPVITPFTLRFVIDETGPRFDACSAESAESRKRILDSAIAAGLEGPATCTIGLGVPTPTWSDAAEIAIKGLSTLGGGSVTFSDADITLIAQSGTEQALFDRVVGEMETSLPDVFALHSTLPVEIETENTIPEFTATLSPEGLLQLRGRLQSDIARDTTESYAQARFGSGATHMAARLDDTLPMTWSVRVMAGLDALSHLHNGVLRVTPDTLSVSGTTGDPDANAEISRILAEKLSQTDHFSIDVSYVETLDPIAQLPTPEECEAEITAIAEAEKLVFEPGSGTLDASAAPIIDKIAEVLRDCGQIRLEIQGHTDSQGREEMNQALSQTRAQSVLNALAERRLLTSTFTAKGYGESQPIADNDTEEGREANRRIAFVLIRPEPVAEEPTTLEAQEANSETGEATPQNTGDGDDSGAGAQTSPEATEAAPDAEEETVDATSGAADPQGETAPQEGDATETQETSDDAAN
ncbi:OmpA family protein [Shimia sp. SDUM112013]|uniref:OmpA family protein n=1 Tax=Shimia sp. SDUM112013 TaxID=3136160 RepID=UPI0032EDB46B